MYDRGRLLAGELTLPGIDGLGLFGMAHDGSDVKNLFDVEREGGQLQHGYTGRKRRDGGQHRSGGRDSEDDHVRIGLDLKAGEGEGCENGSRSGRYTKGDACENGKRSGRYMAPARMNGMQVGLTRAESD